MYGNLYARDQFHANYTLALAEFECRRPLCGFDYVMDGRASSAGAPEATHTDATPDAALLCSTERFSNSPTTTTQEHRAYYSVS